MSSDKFNISMEIAVYLNDNNQTIPFNEAGTVKVYSKDGGEWKVIKEILLEHNDEMSLTAIRENTRTMAESLGMCKVFVAAEVKGVPFTILEGLKFGIWKVKGTPEEFLDYVLEEEEKVKINKLKALDKAKSETIPTPVKDGDDGKYFIDIKTIMESNEKLTSKKILLPFIQNTSFSELEVICDHIPPWFNKEFEQFNLKADIEHTSNGDFKVKIYSNK